MQMYRVIESIQCPQHIEIVQLSAPPWCSIIAPSTASSFVASRLLLPPPAAARDKLVRTRALLSARRRRRAARLRVYYPANFPWSVTREQPLSLSLSLFAGRARNRDHRPARRATPTATGAALLRSCPPGPRRDVRGEVASGEMRLWLVGLGRRESDASCPRVCRFLVSDRWGSSAHRPRPVSWRRLTTERERGDPAGDGATGALTRRHTGAPPLRAAPGLWLGCSLCAREGRDRELCAKMRRPSTAESGGAENDARDSWRHVEGTHTDAALQRPLAASCLPWSFFHPTLEISERSDGILC